MPTSIEFSPLMMREIIMDHYSSPRYKRTPEDKESFISTHSSSVNCIDDIDFFLKLDENNRVKEALWNGVACAISTASTDILCDLLIGKNKEEALYIISQYDAMIHEEEYDASVLGEALAFMNTSKQAARIHCALIGWEAAKKMINGDK